MRPVGPSLFLFMIHLSLANTAIDKRRRLLRPRGRRKLCHYVVMRGEAAGRICRLRVAGQCERLAAATTEIDFLSRTGAARLLHPTEAAKAVEGLPLIP